MLDLAAALDAYKPELAASFERMVRSTFDGLVRWLGPDLRGVANSGSYKVWTNTVSPFCKREKPVSSPGEANPYSIDDARLAKGAADYADATVAEWGAKIRAKLGELEGAEVLKMDGIGFLIRGERAGRTVAIHQRMILNVSSRGTPYNQFPSRIYVDGKFTSEAAYKRLFA